LIAGIAAIPGKISIAATEFYFDADKDHPAYKQMDQEVSYSFTTTPSPTRIQKKHALSH
jgi:hypothetical protein